MASCPRGQIVRPGEVGVYHCWSRCVRRAFLCGQDPLSGKDYEHRRTWIDQMQAVLAAFFGVEIGFRAELSNHIHMVLRNRPDVVAKWSDEEVIRRWLTITKLAKSRDGRVTAPHPARIAIERAIPFRIPILRSRLSDPSWFMGILCEYIARRSNTEDGCRGVFWEDRYGCRDLVDEAAILICGIYVDLNQIRAGEAETPETSVHTSAFDRIRARRRRMEELQEATDPSTPALDDSSGVALLNTTGRVLQPGKPGSIPSHLEGILDRLGIRADRWSAVISGYDKLFGKIVGAPSRVIRRAQEAGRHWYRGIKACKATFC